LTVEGFSADKASDQQVRSERGWKQSTAKWRVASTGKTNFQNGKSFNSVSGRYTARTRGLYLVSANMRLDGAGSGDFRFAAGLNGKHEVQGALTSRDGDPASNYETMLVSGVVMLQTGDYISLWVDSPSDNSYNLQHESGFSVTRLNDISAEHAFMADKAGSSSFGRGYHQIKNWGSEMRNEKRIFNTGSFDAVNGVFTAPVEGIYFYSANLRIENGCGGYFRANIAVNYWTDSRNGRAAIEGGGHCGRKPLNVEGYMLLRKNDHVTLHVYSSSDNSWQVHSESGFGIALIS